MKSFSSRKRFFKIAGIGFMVLLAMFLFHSPIFSALTTTYADNFTIPETQSGFAQENYEVKAFQKLQRGAENFFMGFLEIPHGVKVERARRKAEYLPVGIETFFLGLFRGTGHAAKRMAVGFYEAITFPYAQEPILEEISDWAY